MLWNVAAQLTPKDGRKDLFHLSDVGGDKVNPESPPSICGEKNRKIGDLGVVQLGSRL